MQNSASTLALVRLSANPSTPSITSRLCAQLCATVRTPGFLKRVDDIGSAAFLTFFGGFLLTHIYIAWPRIAEALLGHTGGAL